MTLIECFDAACIKYNVISQEPNITFFNIGTSCVMYWLNDNNVFKMKRRWVNYLENNGKSFRLILRDRREKKFYYVKLFGSNNWVSNCFKDCNKTELFLGKQVLNCRSSLNEIISDLKSISN